MELNLQVTERVERQESKVATIGKEHGNGRLAAIQSNQDRSGHKGSEEGLA